MGVIHKLKDEIVSSIIQRKKEDPSLSCRQLADLISQQYQIKLSKSSINAILKNVLLSSAVGRRASQEQKPKKFQIPSQKKRQLLENMPASIPEASGEIPTMAPAPSEKKALPEETPRPKSKPSFKKERLLEEIQALRVQRTTRTGRRYEGLGYIFLKAAEWEISKTSILAGLLRRYIKEPLPTNFNEICEGWLFFQIHNGTKDHAHQYRDHGLWFLNGLDDKMSTQTLLDWGKAIQAALPTDQTAYRATIRYFHEKQQNFLEVSGMKLFLEDGTTLVTDAQMATFWEERIPAKVTAVLNKTIRYLSQRLISNNQSAVFYMTPAYQWIAAFANLPGKRITKITVLGFEGDEMACFSTVPFKKRFFVTGVWPWQKEFSSFTKNQSKVQSHPFYHRALDKIFHYVDTSQEVTAMADFIGQSLKAAMSCLRVILLWEETNEDLLMALLTNQMETGAQEILTTYMERWPNLNEGPLLSWLKERNFVQPPANPEVKGKNDFINKSLDASELFHDFGTALHQYCQRHFFHREISSRDLTQMKSIYYNIPGHLDQQEGFSRIVLSPPDSYAHDQDLEYAVKRLNESNIIDPVGRRVWVEIIG